ncbi:MAG: lysophospholipid acyltransferase family protein, partial [Gemmatimonadaceae bacterium]
PVFGPAIRAIGMVPIQRENRKAAFGAYDEAAAKIKEGNSVVVFPEGTRGSDYPIRPFKKGPFVLAIAAGVPVVPVLTYGTREVLPRGSFLIRPTTVHIHLLEPIPVAGMDYAARGELAEMVRMKIVDALESNYGIESVRRLPPEPAISADMQTSTNES